MGMEGFWLSVIPSLLHRHLSASVLAAAAAAAAARADTSTSIFRGGSRGKKDFFPLLILGKWRRRRGLLCG